MSITELTGDNIRIVTFFKNILQNAMTIPFFKDVKIHGKFPNVPVFKNGRATHHVQTLALIIYIFHLQTSLIIHTLFTNQINHN